MIVLRQKIFRKSSDIVGVQKEINPEEFAKGVSRRAEETNARKVVTRLKRDAESRLRASRQGTGPRLFSPENLRDAHVSLTADKLLQGSKENLVNTVRRTKVPARLATFQKFIKKPR